MTLEERIRRLEDAIKHHVELRDWFRSHEWRESRENDAELGENLDQAIEDHDRNINTYENILATLRAR